MKRERLLRKNKAKNPRKEFFTSNQGPICPVSETIPIPPNFVTDCRNPDLLSSWQNEKTVFTNRQRLQQLAFERDSAKKAIYKQFEAAGQVGDEKMENFKINKAQRKKSSKIPSETQLSSTEIKKKKEESPSFPNFQRPTEDRRPSRKTAQKKVEKQHIVYMNKGNGERVGYNCYFEDVVGVQEFWRNQLIRKKKDDDDYDSDDEIIKYAIKLCLKETKQGIAKERLYEKDYLNWDSKESILRLDREFDQSQSQGSLFELSKESSILKKGKVSKKKGGRQKANKFERKRKRVDVSPENLKKENLGSRRANQNIKIDEVKNEKLQSIHFGNGRNSKELRLKKKSLRRKEQFKNEILRKSGRTDFKVMGSIESIKQGRSQREGSHPIDSENGGDNSDNTANLKKKANPQEIKGVRMKIDNPQSQNENKRQSANLKKNAKNGLDKMGNTNNQNLDIQESLERKNWNLNCFKPNEISDKIPSYESSPFKTYRPNYSFGFGKKENLEFQTDNNQESLGSAPGLRAEIPCDNLVFPVPNQFRNVALTGNQNPTAQTTVHEAVKIREDAAEFRNNTNTTNNKPERLANKILEDETESHNPRAGFRNMNENATESRPKQNGYQYNSFLEGVTYQQGRVLGNFEPINHQNVLRAREISNPGNVNMNLFLNPYEVQNSVSEGYQVVNPRFTMNDMFRGSPPDVVFAVPGNTELSTRENTGSEDNSKTKKMKYMVNHKKH